MRQKLAWAAPRISISSGHDFLQPPLKKLFVQGSLPAVLRLGWRSGYVFVANHFHGFLEIRPHQLRDTGTGFIASSLEDRNRRNHVSLLHALRFLFFSYRLALSHFAWLLRLARHAFFRRRQLAWTRLRRGSGTVAGALIRFGWRIRAERIAQAGKHGPKPRRDRRKG